MSVPNVITDLSATASANSPSGTDPIGTLADDYLRAGFAIMRKLYDDLLAGTVGPFPSGTIMLFQQTAAPTGWTKITTHNDKTLRVVSGSASSGGAGAFTSIFGSGKNTAAYTLLTADIPSHTHAGVTAANNSDHHHAGTTNSMNANTSHDHTGAETTDVNLVGGGSGAFVRLNSSSTVSYTSAANIDHAHDFTTSGADATHTHNFTTNATGGGGSHSHGLSLDLQYVDVIFASKN